MKVEMQIAGIGHLEGPSWGRIGQHELRNFLSVHSGSSAELMDFREEPDREGWSGVYVGQTRVGSWRVVARELDS